MRSRRTNQHLPVHSLSPLLLIPERRAGEESLNEADGATSRPPPAAWSATARTLPSVRPPERPCYEVTSQPGGRLLYRGSDQAEAKRTASRDSDALLVDGFWEA